MKEKQGVLSLKTQAGCLRLLALFVGGGTSIQLLRSVDFI